MNIDTYVDWQSESGAGSACGSAAKLTISEQQASDFARGEARDFNPIHDPDNRRFCVPGDLLFSALMHHYGVASQTRVDFLGMLDGNTSLSLPVIEDVAGEAFEPGAAAMNGDDVAAASLPGQAILTDANGRDMLRLTLVGRRRHNADMLARLCSQYVRFSGQTFPEILVPVMRDAGRMINPTRPLVIYRDMRIDIEESGDSDDLVAIDLEYTGAESHINGRKGDVSLNFDLVADGKLVGRGQKNLMLGGLRDYDEDAMQQIVDDYEQRRSGKGQRFA